MSGIDYLLAIGVLVYEFGVHNPSYQVRMLAQAILKNDIGKRHTTVVFLLMCATVGYGLLALLANWLHLYLSGFMLVICLTAEICYIVGLFFLLLFMKEI